MRTLAMIRVAVAGLLCAAAAVLGNNVALACTAFCAVGAGQVLVGNNEDWDNPRTKIRFIPARPGVYGRMYVGFDDLRPQGGMNERGLWFDGFSAPAVGAGAASELPPFPGDIVDAAMAECSTVEEVVRLFRRYNREFLTEGILMFADASGDAVSIERNAIVRKTGSHFVQTNFHQSLSTRKPDGRFTVASRMLEGAGDAISVDLFRRILAATHQKGASPTLYSNIYELRSRTMHLYYFQDFERMVTFNLADELKKGERVLDIPALFPKNAAADAFAARRQADDLSPGPEVATAFFAVLALLGALALYGGIRGGRQVRIGLSLAVGSIVVIVVVTAITLSMHSNASGQWIQFSIGPASGDSSSINSSMVRANGMTLKQAVATAYDMPAVRVIAPEWFAQTRYSINAVVGVDASESFRPLLQEELKKRLRLETHLEVRPFDVFVLTATGTPRLERAQGESTSIRISKTGAQFREAPMQGLASALQSILGKPVIDETGITGTYNLEFDWGEDRATSVTATLRDRFGLQLSAGTRDMEVLIVDSVRRDASLVLLAQIGRATRGAPPQVRRHISNVLTIR